MRRLISLKLMNIYTPIEKRQSIEKVNDVAEDEEIETLAAPAPLTVHIYDAPAKFNEFVIQSMKKDIFPHSSELAYVAMAFNNLGKLWLKSQTEVQ